MGNPRAIPLFVGLESTETDPAGPLALVAEECEVCDIECDTECVVCEVDGVR